MLKGTALAKTGALTAVAWDGDTMILQLYIQPKSSSDQFIGLHGTLLKVKISAPAVEGLANAHLCYFLAQYFQVAKHQVILEKGRRGRYKRVRITAPVQLPAHFREIIAPLGG